MKSGDLLVTRDRPNVLCPAYWNGISKTSRVTQSVYGTRFQICWTIFLSRGTSQFIFRRREWESRARHIGLRLQGDPRYWKRIIRQVERGERLVNSFLQAEPPLTSISLDHLIRQTAKIQRIWLHYDATSVFGWFVAADRLAERIADLNKLTPEEMHILTAPNKPSEVATLEAELIKRSLVVLAKRQVLDRAAQRLSKRYGWIPFGYDGPTVWGTEHFKKELTKKVSLGRAKLQGALDNISNQKKERARLKLIILKRKSISNKAQRQLGIIAKLTEWTDYRKRLEYQLHIMYSNILAEISRLTDVPALWLKYLMTEELPLLVLNRPQAVRLIKQRQTEDFVVQFSNGRSRVLSDKLSKKIIRLITPKSSAQMVWGKVASAGPKKTYHGPARVLESAQQCARVKAGDFIITTMTTPEYAPAMRRAAGFITDEGGVTCHAAIVAREMNKPCIIGTKVATKVFKDGDRVEVDATKGIVRKI